MNEREIVALFFARDERAIKEFIRLYGKLCRGIALGVTGDARTAEECLNDACLRLWNAIPPEDPVSLRAYAARIVRNLAMNRMAAEKALRRSAVLEELDETAQAADVSLEEEVVGSLALAGAIDRFLAGRTREEAAVFVRRYFSGESMRKIARAAGTSPATVARMLKRLRHDLAAELKKEGIDA